MEDSIILNPYNMGDIMLSNRVVMAPMTRCRAINNIPNQMMVDYYANRSSAGLIITEGTSPSQNGLGYARIPGIFTEAQIKGWQLVTNKVHNNGGKIFVQLMHTGRISHPLSMPKTAKILAPSAIKAKGQMWTDLMGMQDFHTPIPMSIEQIKSTITEYIVSSENAIKAGFDGVEIHCANGYLIEQFLNPESNGRIDIYGGSIVNRARFLMEIVQGVSNSIGQNRVGVRLSPYGRANDMPLYSNILNTYDYIASELNKLDVAYIHLLNQMDADVAINYNNVQSVIRSNFKNTLIICGGYDYNSAKNSIEHKMTDLIAFGRPFINNPDLVERFKNNWEMSKDLKLDLFYSGGQEGYNDYPNYYNHNCLLTESINS